MPRDAELEATTCSTSRQSGYGTASYFRRSSTPITRSASSPKPRSIAQRRLSENTYLRTPHDARDLLTLRLLGNPDELFMCVFLDNRHRVIACEVLFRGTIDGCAVHPRVIVRQALLCNAAAVILAHTHPNGVCEPSEAERRLTEQIKDALPLIEVRVLDHFVVGVENAVSMAERGLM